MRKRNKRQMSMTHHWRDSIASFVINVLALILALAVLYVLHRWIWGQYRPLSPEPVEQFLRVKLALF